MISSRYNGYGVHLIQSLEEMYKIKSLITPKVHVGIDTETDGLDVQNNIAGVCISAGKSYSTKDYHGFYIPVRHFNYDKNLPVDKVIEFLQEIIDSTTTVFWNRDFDATMLEKDGLKFPSPGRTHDGQCMAHLVRGDSFPALKDWAEKMLHFSTIHFEENNTNNFKQTDPTISYVYAAQDPIITALTSRAIWATYPYIHKIYPIDNAFAECMRKIMYSTDLYLDHDLLNKMHEDCCHKIQLVKNKIFAYTGYQFRLTSAKDKADALSRYVTLTQKTASGKYQINDEVLSGIDHPLARMFQEFSEYEKLRGTYLAKMQGFPQPFHINYQHCNVSTGRMSSGGAKGNSFFASFNIQNVPKIEVFRYLHFEPASPCKFTLTDEKREYQVFSEGMESIGDREFVTYKGLYLSPSTYIKQEDTWVRVPYENVVTLPAGYEDTEDTTHTKNGVTYSIVSCEMSKCKGGMRDLFICPPGYIWVSADYSSEEMVLMANFSKEPNLINPLKAGEDIHKYVGTRMFGHYDKAHRTIAKIINFASNYGASGYTIGKRLGKSEEEGNALLARYNTTMSKLYAWKQSMIKTGRTRGMVFTYFGRPRYVMNWYQSSNPGDHGFGDRTCMNTPVQGCLPANTLIQTREGLVPIVSFTCGEVWNGLCWTYAERFDKGEAELVRITTKSGKVFECDDRHIMKVADDDYHWAHISDIKPGTKLCVNNRSDYAEDFDFWQFLLGYITGDGNVTERFRSSRSGTRREVTITFGVHEKRRAEWFAKKLESAGFHVGIRYTKPTVLQLTVSSKEFVSWLKNLGMSPNCTATTKHVPDSTFAGDARSFLYGLYLSDGSHGKWPAFHMNNHDLLADVALLLGQYGFTTSLHKTRNAWLLDVHANRRDFVRWCRTGDFRSFKSSESVPVNVAKSAVDCFEGYPATSSEAAICRKIKNGGSCSAKSLATHGYTGELYATDEVVSVEYTGARQSMYTLATEHPLHQFVTEGFISKNTGGDIIRIDHIKVYNMLNDPKQNPVELDPECGDEPTPAIKYCLTVHDEINIYVKPRYMQYGFEKLQSIMNMTFPNWEVPLTVSPSVGVDFGHQIELRGFSESGIPIPDVDPDFSVYG